MSVCRRVGSQSGGDIPESFSTCDECGHTRALHPGFMNKGLTACVICELLAPPTCQRPPKDWEPCRRTPGHDGTCSPYPDVSEASLARPLTVPFFDIPLYGVPEEGLISDAPSPYLVKNKRKPLKRALLEGLRPPSLSDAILVATALGVYAFCFYWVCTR